jgi:predicted GNAT superfamily acetyltransferase
MDYTVRDLTTHADFQAVFALELEVWHLPNGDDAVPAILLAVGVKHGAILVGAFDAAGRLVAFAYSFPALTGGRLIQWSHMLGVAEGHRGAGLGRRLKLEQRARAIGQGIDVIAWTFDPLQAGNAAFNLEALGAEAGEYVEDVYGASDSPLHAGAPTDRLVAEWRLTTDKVRAAAGEIAGRPPGPPARGPTRHIHRVTRHGPWLVPDGEPDLSFSADVVGIRVPPAFTEMLRERPDLARAWRAATRQSFSAAFVRGYRAVGFERDEVMGGGSYVLRRGNPEA